MGWLTAGEISQLRTDGAAALPGTAVIYRQSSGTDTYGYASGSWAAVGTAAVRLEPMNLADAAGVAGAGELTRATFTFFLPTTADVLNGDRLVVTGDTLEITMLHDLQHPGMYKIGRCARLGN